MSTCTRVLYYRWNHYGGILKWNSAIRPDELTILTLTLVQPEAFKQHLDRWDIPCSRLLNSQRWWYYMTARRTRLPLPCYGAMCIIAMARSHPRLGMAVWVIPLREHPVDHKWYHIEVPVGVPSGSTQCLDLLRVLEPPDVVHHWGCRFASLSRRRSISGRPLALKPYVHLL